jgi:hypothetical protein
LDSLPAFWSIEVKVFIVRAASPRAGAHTAELNAIEKIPGNWGRGALRFNFLVDEGVDQGAEISRIVSAEPRVGNSLAGLLGELLGRELVPGEAIPPSNLIGQRYKIVVAIRQRTGDDAGGAYECLASVAPLTAEGGAA